MEGTVCPCCAWTWLEVSPLAGRPSVGPGPECPPSSPRAGAGEDRAARTAGLTPTTRGAARVPTSSRQAPWGPQPASARLQGSRERPGSAPGLAHSLALGVPATDMWANKWDQDRAAWEASPEEAARPPAARTDGPPPRPRERSAPLVWYGVPPSPSSGALGRWLGPLCTHRGSRAPGGRGCPG